MHRSKHIAAIATELSDEQKYPQGAGLADRPVDGITPPLTYRDASLRMWTDGCKVVSSALWALGRSAKAGEQLVLPNGGSMTQRQVYVEAIRLDGHNARAYCSLARTLVSYKSFTLPDGRSLRKQDLFLEAIRRDASYGSAYVELGSPVPTDVSVALPDGRSLTKRGLFLSSSMHRSKHIAAVATELSDEQKYPQGGDLADRPVDGITPPLTYRDACLRMWTDGYKVVSSALWALGRSAKAGEQLVLPNGGSMTQREAYVWAIRLDGHNARAYCSLARTLVSYKSFTLPDSRTLYRDELFLEAIRHDASYASAYVDLGHAFPTDGSAALPDGRSLTKRELYLEALRHDPTLSMAYRSVGALLKTGETVTLPDGRTLSQRALYLEALRHDPSNSLAYWSLGSISAGESVALSDGRSLTKRELYLEALRHDSTFSMGYKNVGICLTTPDETVAVPFGRKLDKHALCWEARHHDPANSYAYLDSDFLEVLRHDPWRDEQKRGPFVTATTRSSSVPTTGNVPRRRARQQRAPEDVCENRNDESTMGGADHKRHRREG
jgi:hypothetical protein